MELAVFDRENKVKIEILSKNCVFIVLKFIKNGNVLIFNEYFNKKTGRKIKKVSRKSKDIEEINAFLDRFNIKFTDFINVNYGYKILQNR